MDKKIEYEIDDHFFLRIPRLGINEYHKISANDDYEIIDYFNEYFKEEILVESYDLFKSLEYENKDIKKISNSLRKCFIRSSTRCTPFGLNAAVLRGRFEDINNYSINTADFEKDVYVDSDWYIKLIALLEKKIGDNLLVRFNNTVEMNEDLILNNWVDGFKQSFINAENIILNNTNALKYIYTKIGQGYCQISKLKSELYSEFCKVNHVTIDNFINELLEKQILISNLKPNTLSPRSLTLLLSCLKKYNCEQSIIMNLEKIAYYIDQYMQVPIGKGVEKHLILKEEMEHLLVADNYLNTDLYNNSVISFETAFKENILDYFTFLTRFAEVNGYSERYFDSFIDKFGNQAVPIRKVFDSVIGIGYPMKTEFKKNKKFAFLHEYIIENYSDEIQIDENKVSNINKSEDFSFMGAELSFNIMEENSEKLLVCNQLLGSNQQYKTMGRFHKYSSLYKVEESEELVELVYFPKQSKIANVLNCNSIAKYYVEYGSHYDIPNMTRINFDDICMIPVGNKLKFINKKTSKFLKFVVSNMVNLALMPIHLQSIILISEGDNYNLFNFFTMLNRIFEGYKKKPRITYKNIVLQSKSITIDKNDGSIDEIISKTQAYIQCDYLLCGNNDNYLLLDLKKKSHKEILDKMIKSEGKVNIKENYFNENNSLIKDQNGFCYFSEFIFEIKPKDIKKPALIEHPLYLFEDIDVDNRDRWMSFKIYLRKEYMNYVIKGHIFERLKKDLSNYKMKKMFFIRYCDIDYHLRIRILIDNDCQKEYVMELYDYFLSLQKKGILKQIIIDEYIPEINRYGGIEVIKDIETIFMQSSILSGNLISNHNLNSKIIFEQNYYYFVILVITNMYQNIEDQVNVMQRYQKFYIRDNKYLGLKKEFMKNYIQENNLKFVKQIINETDILLIENICSILKKIQDKICNHIRFNEILISLFHMHFNRLVGIDREQENKINGLIENTFFSISGVAIKPSGNMSREKLK